MKRFRLACLGALLCLSPGDSAAAGERHPGKPVALVYALAGQAVLTAPAQASRPLRLFDRLPVGATVEVGPGSRLALALMNGLRYELGERSRVTLGAKDLAARSGPVRPLPPVPPLPRLSPIAEEDQAGLRAGAVHIRTERIAGLYPRGGAATIAGATVLRFAPVEGSGSYRVEVHDRQGNVVFEDETKSTAVNLPAGVLQPSTRYGWTVRTFERIGPVARGEAAFITLARDIAEQREALRRVAEAAGDSALLALLGEVDRSLGLLAEAREELREAVRASPEDAALAADLTELERQLKEEGHEDL